MLNAKEVSFAVSRLMPHIIQGVHLDFLVSRSITQTQFLVLVAIHSRGTCPMNILADSMQVSMPTMSGIVDRLVKAGYLDRLEDSQDRRQVVIKLTNKGKKMIEQFQGAVGERWQEVLQVLSKQELAAFHAVVMKLTDKLQKR